MDYIEINGNQIPYPNDFTMNTEPIIVNEITTMNGYTYADIVGVKFSDTTMNWDYLKEEELMTLLSETNPLNGTFELKFAEPEGGTGGWRRINALRVGRVVTKTALHEPDGGIVWSGIAITLRFPYAIT